MKCISYYNVTTDEYYCINCFNLSNYNVEYIPIYEEEYMESRDVYKKNINKCSDCNSYLLNIEENYNKKLMKIL